MNNVRSEVVPVLWEQNVILWETYGGILKYVACRTCGCRTAYRSDEKTAVAEWNRRADEEEQK